jgi:hypothetical protein
MKRISIFIALLVSNIALISNVSANEHSKIIIKKDTKSYSTKTIKNKMEEILTEVENIRHLKVSKPVSVGIKTTKELNKYLAKTIDKEYSDIEIRKEKLLYQHFGVIEKSMDFKQALLNLYTQQIAGLYDDKSKEFFIIERNGQSSDDGETDVVVSHELVHAIQDQNFNIDKYVRKDTNNDVISAKMAVIEGEATVVSMQYIFTQSPLFAGNVPDIESLMDNPLVKLLDTGSKNIPGFFKEQLYFPYTKGSKFIQELHKHFDKDWKKMDIVYKNPPVSTEQIMHPEKYLKNEKPENIVLNKKIVDKEFKLVDTNSLGEFFMFNFFLEYLTENDSKIASEGWNGDKIQIYANKNDDTFIVMNTSWDTTKDANEFFDYYKETVKERFSKLKVLENKPNKFLAQYDGKKVLITKNKNRVNLAEGFTPKIEKKIL